MAVLDGSLGVLPGRVGVWRACGAFLVVTGWPWCRRGRSLPGHPGTVVWEVPGQRVAAGVWCSLALFVVLRGCWWWLGAPFRPPCCWCAGRPSTGLSGCMVARVLQARAVGAVGGAGPCDGGCEGVRAVCGPTALVGTVARVGGGGRCARGTRDGVMRCSVPLKVRGLSGPAGLGRGG